MITQISVPRYNRIFQKGYKNDTLAQKLKGQQPNEGLLELNRKTYIPEPYIHEVIRDHYDNSAQGYLEVAKTIELLKRNYSASKLKKYIEEYIKKYIICQRNKATRYKKYGEIQFAEVLITP